ncbi:MAG: ABC transporter ATP-binding protein [Planctomycetota bacterium]|jgi:ABC-2 type transport system ATP-binding protein
MNSSIIHVSGLSKVYKSLTGTSVEALRGVDLRVEPGQAFGLLGPNGAGKTTLVKILLGLVHPTSGDVQLMGADAGRPAARRRVGYMPELRNYPRFLTAATCLDLFGRLHGVPAADRRRRTDEVLADVDLAQWRDHKVGGFSKGMKQRLALAQALLNEPEVLFLDEPAEGIDPLGRVVVRNILRRVRERGTTLFMNSHLLTEVEMVCDEVAILHEGRVVESGVLAELTSRQREYRLTVASDAERVPALLDGSIGGIEPVTGLVGLNAWHLTVQDRDELNAALDRLRRENVLIDGIEPVRSSLEEVFLRAVEGAERESRPSSEPSPSHDRGPISAEAGS